MAKRTDFEYPPEHLCFTRSTGVRYLHFARDILGYPTYEATDYVKSLESGKVKKMSEFELIEFKKG